MQICVLAKSVAIYNSLKMVVLMFFVSQQGISFFGKYTDFSRGLGLPLVCYEENAIHFTMFLFLKRSSIMSSILVLKRPFTSKGKSSMASGFF